MVTPGTITGVAPIAYTRWVTAVYGVSFPKREVTGLKFDPRDEGKKATYFKMIECIVPRPIAWVSSMSGEGTLNLAPFSFFTGVTSTPPTLLFCAGNKRGGVPKDTPANIAETGEFVVNIVPMDITQSMVQTSAPYDASVDEFEAVGLTTLPSERISVPRVAESPIAFECRLHSIQEIEEAGRITSRIVIGYIELIHIADGILDGDGRVDVARLNPVSRLGGQLYAPVGNPFEVPRPTLSRD